MLQKKRSTHSRIRFSYKKTKYSDDYGFLLKYDPRGELFSSLFCLDIEQIVIDSSGQCWANSASGLAMRNVL